MDRRLPLLFLVLTLAGGWMAGRYCSPSTAPSAPLVTAADIDRSRSTRDTLPITDPNTLARRVDALLSQGHERTYDPFHTIMEASKFAMSLQADEFGPAVAQLSQNMGDRTTLLCASLIAGYWMEVDTPAAVAWFERLPLNLQEKFKSSIFSTWALKNQKEMLSWLERLPEDKLADLRVDAFHILKVNQTSLRPEDFDRAQAIIKTSQRGIGEAGGFKYGLFYALANASPAEAAARALALPSSTGRTNAIVGVAAGWAKADLTAARKWVESLEDPVIAQFALRECVREMKERDVKGAAEWVASLPDTVKNQKTLGEIVSTWANDDLKGALAWVDALPPEAGREKYVGSILSGLAEQDLELAMKTMMQRTKEGLPLDSPKVDEWRWNRLQEEYVKMKGVAETLKAAGDFPNESNKPLDSIYRDIVTAAAKQNFSETTQWLTGQQSSERKGQAFKSLAMQVLNKDQAEAIRWVGELPKDRDTDRARHMMADNLFQRDAESAVKIYRQITDPQKGEEYLSGTVRNWLKSDPAKAEEWLNKTSAFSAQVKAGLRQKGATP